MGRLLIGAIRLYQFAISPLLPPSCRFYPSCSQYAAEAVARHGAVRGSALAGLRLLKCHPWHEGGFDPVPGSGDSATQGTSGAAGLTVKA